MKQTMKIAIAALLAAALMGTSGCVLRKEFVGREEPAETSTSTVPLEGAQWTDVDISIGAGELSMRGGELGEAALSGEFTYAPSSMKPEVKGSVRGDGLKVTVTQPRFDPKDLGWSLAGYTNDWDLQLAKNLPMDLRVSAGAGNCELDLRDLHLISLALDLGAGDLDLDLSSGYPVDRMEAEINAGAGDVTIRLPKNIGVRVNGGEYGLKNWDYPGFKKDGDALVNDAWAESGPVIELHVQQGAGNLTLELVD